MLFRNNSLLELHHCQPKKYYDKVLLAESDGVLAVQAIRDAGEGLEPLSLAADCQQEIRALQDDVPEQREEPTMPPVARLALAAQDEALDEDHTRDSYMLDFALGTLSGTDEENPMEVESPQHQASVEPMLGRNVHPDSFVWGPFRLTFSDESKRPPHGAWQATCPYHRLNDVTGCKRSMVLGVHEDSKDLCKRALMTWCLEAPLRKTKKAHAAAPCKVEDALAEAVLNRRLKTCHRLRGKLKQMWRLKLQNLKQMKHSLQQPSKKAAKPKTEPKGKEAKKSAKKLKAKAAKTLKKSSSSGSIFGFRFEL